MAVCECASCGLSFTGISAFDRHQETDYARCPAVRCTDPASAGLVQQASGRWGLPPDARSRVRLSTLRAAEGRPLTQPRGGVSGVLP